MGGAAVRGQALVITALVLPFLVAFLMVVLEVGARWLEVQMLEDALQHTTRSVVQYVDYATLARGAGHLRVTSACIDVPWNGDPNCQALLTVARDLLITNLTGVRGMGESPEALADRVRWTVLPNGGTCRFSSSRTPQTTQPTPLVCAEVRPVMTGLLGWGTYTPLIIAADTLDQH